MAITLLPTPPSRQDPINFNVRADEFLGALPTFGTEANSLASDVNSKQITASNAATTATNAASTATTKAGEALASANAAATSASSANTARLAAEAAFDSFDDRYLGQKTGNPTTDNDGNPLIVGALYFRTTAPIGMKVWTGTGWDDAYANLASKFDKTGGDVDGNLNFTGTGRRITGDFSNATVNNRTMFQTRVANDATDLTIVPNGTATYAAVSARSSDSENASVAALAVDGAAVTLASHKTGSGAYLPLRFVVGSAERLRIDPAGNVLATSGALGYGVGNGGTVVQATSKSAAVTLNKPCGQITMNNAALAAGASVTFQLNDILITNADCLAVTLRDDFSPANYSVRASVGTGGGRISITNISGVSLSEAVVLNFEIVKGTTS